jgi:ammonium transporter Rh
MSVNVNAKVAIPTNLNVGANVGGSIQENTNLETGIAGATEYKNGVQAQEDNQGGVQAQEKLHMNGDTPQVETNVEMTARSNVKLGSNNQGGEVQLETARDGAVVATESAEVVIKEGEHAHEEYHTSVWHRYGFIFIFLLMEVVVMFLFAFYVIFNHDLESAVAGSNDNTTTEHVKKYYPMFQDIHVMVLVGFGFLYTYLRRQSWYSMSMNFMLMIWSIQISILLNGFFHMIIKNKFEPIEIEIRSLIMADFAAATVLVSFGAVIGKFNSGQLLTMATLEMWFYTANVNFGEAYLMAMDMGGSMFIHSFGAYFGISCAFTYSIGKYEKLINHKWNSSSYNSNLFSYIGCAFLWLFWPSFNGSLSSGNSQHRIIINTVLSLTCSALAVFLINPLLNRHGKLKMENVLNATLAGGVGIGAACDILAQPWSAMLIGFISGTISLLGFEYVSPFLQKKLNIYDTAGIHNLHGLPGLFGSVVGVILSAAADQAIVTQSLKSIFPDLGPRTNTYQAYMQAAALASSLLFSISGGLIVGAILRAPCFDSPKGVNEMFTDIPYFEEVDELLGDDTIAEEPLKEEEPKAEV